MATGSTTVPEHRHARLTFLWMGTLFAVAIRPAWLHELRGHVHGRASGRSCRFRGRTGGLPPAQAAMRSCARASCRLSSVRSPPRCSVPMTRYSTTRLRSRQWLELGGMGPLALRMEMGPADRAFSAGRLHKEAGEDVNSGKLALIVQTSDGIRARPRPFPSASAAPHLGRDGMPKPTGRPIAISAMPPRLDRQPIGAPVGPPFAPHPHHLRSTSGAVARCCDP